MSINVNDKNLGHATAYGYAVSKGFTGTEEEFAEMMASYADVAQDAEASAQAASASASAAATSASNASASAQTASTKASEASASATSASQSATSASTSANNASDSASTASAKATQASQSATNAANSATDANTAKNDAVTAKEAAQAAQTAAETAQGKAEDAQEAAETAQESIEQTINSKADIDGTYESMTAGASEQLLSDEVVEDSVPYVFRKTNGVGTKMKDEIVGGTIAWNQLMTTEYRNTGGTVTVDANNVATFMADATGQQVYSSFMSVANHVYIGVVHFKTSGSTDVKMRAFVTDIPSVSTTSYQVGYAMNKQINNSSATVGVVDRRESGWDSTEVKYIQVFDLTQMFGTDVADYIYGLEQATAGAGVAFFRSLFPQPYYEYNKGELLSVSDLVAHQTVGFNQWDEEWEVGSYKTDVGTKQAESDRIRSKNFIPCLPNTDYFYYAGGANCQAFFYDANQSYLGTYINYSNSHQFRTPIGCHFMTFNTNAAYGTTYNNDICINFSDSVKNGTYEPYVKRSYPLDSSLTLRGVPKLVSNKLQFDGDIYKADGSVTRKYGVVDLGTLSWTAGTYAFYATPLSMKPFTNLVITPKYTFANLSTSANLTDGQFMTGAGEGKSVWFHKGSYSDATAFKTAMSGEYLVYELATPTSETAEPFTELQTLDKNGTEEYVANSIVPVGHNTKYYVDLKGKIEGLPSDFSTLIAPTEATMKASQNYTVGDLLIVNNILYKVTANIANGGTITPNTNVTATTLSALIKALSA